MHNIRKQLSLLLLSCLVIIAQDALADYSNPFVPVYAKGDDISRAIIKPQLIYESVKDTRIVIPNMPAYKTQDDIAECRAFSLATVLQKYTCDQWKNDIPDCKNPPSDSAISYFGLMAYTNQTENIGTLDVKQPHRNIVEIINNLSKSGNKLILDSCKTFDNLVNSFSAEGAEGLKKRDKFFSYLDDLYNKKKSKTEADIADCPECLNEINKTSGLNINLTNLKKALTKDTYDKFLYSLFFEGCKMEEFPSGFSARAYPSDDLNVTSNDIKNQIIEGLKKGKPVLYSNLCTVPAVGNECPMGHTTVISGYDRVCSPVEKNKCKDRFKLHNSWGSEWQKVNNDGWVDADVLTANTIKIKTNEGYKISSASVVWLDP